MGLVDRYLLAEWLKVFALALLATLAVLWLHDLYGNLGDFRNYGAGLGQVALYYAVLLPSFLPVVLPVSQLVSLLFALGALHRHNEIIALRTAGLSLWRISRPLWLGGAVLAALVWWLNATLAPWSIEQARAWRENLRYRAEAAAGYAPQQIGRIPQLTYDNHAQRRLWMISHFSDYAYRGSGIAIYELDHLGRNRRHLLANEGYFDDAAGHWVLLHGAELLFDQEEARVYRNVRFAERAFPELRETPGLMQTLRARPADLSLGELGAALALAPPAENPAMHAYALRYHAKLASPFLCLIVVGLAVPFAVAGVRVNPMVGVAKTVGLFFAYYVLVNLCTVLGGQQYLPAVVAAWLPNVLVLTLALALFRRAA